MGFHLKEKTAKIVRTVESNNQRWNIVMDQKTARERMRERQNYQVVSISEIHRTFKKKINKNNILRIKNKIKGKYRITYLITN